MSTGAVYLVELAPRPTAVVRQEVGMAGIGEFVGGAMDEVARVLAQQGRQVTGPPFGCYRPVEGGLDAEVGFPTDGDVEPAGRVLPGTLPGGVVATALHVGNYEGLETTYAAMTEWLTARGCTPTGPAWESYLDGPEVPDPRTLVRMPCQEHRP